jgi:hypothetical protein
VVKSYRSAHAADVVVFGAGPAGIAAAVAAARRRRKVCLIELQNVVGGVMSSCPGMMLGSGYPCGTSVGGFFEEFVGRLFHQDPPVAERRACSLENFGDEVVYEHEYALSALYDMLAEAGVEVLLNHLPCRVCVADDEIVHVDVATTQGVDRFTAGVYIDCTGSGDVAAGAGVPSQLGDERGRTMGATLTFFMLNVDWDKAFPPGSDPYFTHYAERGIAEGRLPRTMPQLYMLKGFRQGTVYVNTVTVTGVDGTDARSVARGTQTARRHVMALARFCREEIPGFEDSHVVHIGPAVGVRETRRLEGLYRLTVADIAAATKFEDGVVACDSPLDEVFRDDSSSVYSHEAALPEGEYYTIPFRTLVPQKVRNLLFAGRARSVELKAYATGRGMPQCMVIGQSVGVGAAMAITDGCTVQEIDRAQLVRELLLDGVNGIGERRL